MSTSPEPKRMRKESGAIVSYTQQSRIPHIIFYKKTFKM